MRPSRSGFEKAGANDAKNANPSEENEIARKDRLKTRSD